MSEPDHQGSPYWNLADNRNCGVARQVRQEHKARHHYFGRDLAVIADMKESASLRELLRTNDIVLVSAVGALLDGANIGHLLLDNNMSIAEGSLGIIPRRILVHDDDNLAARRLLTDAGLGHELRDDT